MRNYDNGVFALRRRSLYPAELRGPKTRILGEGVLDWYVAVNLGRQLRAWQATLGLAGISGRIARFREMRSGEI